MKKLSLCVLFFIAASLWAAAPTNFTGDWKLDESKIDQENQRGRFMTALQLNVKQETKLSVERVSQSRDGEEYKNTETYTLDGKENTNEMRSGKKISTLSFSPDGKKLTIQSTSTFERNGNTFEMESTETWSLQEEGKVLMVETKTKSYRGERESSNYYNKVVK